MAALRYDIHLRTNTFAHHVTDPETVETSVPNILEKREDIVEACFAEARYYDELTFRDENPYAPGGIRAGWDPTTGLPKQYKPAAGKQQPINPWAPPAPAQYGYGQQYPAQQPQFQPYQQYQLQYQQPAQLYQQPYQQPVQHQQPYGPLQGGSHPAQGGDQKQGTRGHWVRGYKGNNFIANYQDSRRNQQQQGAQSQGKDQVK
ncbi:hypothetical protein PCANC_23883 [Puccinia coronata f. sp. avenae]|uniref:Uncharacterized protein n=1 Tax=Puccinia coronata f. sp. avenae TaxID=200324 RepID=A0A2N5TZ35_9BASI|nr:hypothetical protein PCANC_23883 [Puccinia coronata f. sp. avenae]